MCDNYERHHICIMEVLEGEEREKGTDEIFEIMMTENFPQMNVKHHSTDLIPGSINAKKKKKPQQKIHPIPQHIIFKLQKVKDKEKKTLKEGKENKTLPTKEQIYQTYLISSQKPCRKGSGVK